MLSCSSSPLPIANSRPNSLMSSLRLGSTIKVTAKSAAITGKVTATGDTCSL